MKLNAAIKAALDAVLQQSNASDSNNMDEDDDNLPSSESTDIEIVGLQSCSNGRSCCIHEVCGDYVEVGDLLRLVSTVVKIRGETQEAIKLVRLMDGADGCTVAFIPRILQDLPKVQNNLSKFVQVKELYRDSTNSVKIHKSFRNMGCASCYFLEDVPVSE